MQRRSARGADVLAAPEAAAFMVASVSIREVSEPWSEPSVRTPDVVTDFCSKRFPVVIVQFLALRNYALLHNEL